MLTEFGGIDERVEIELAFIANLNFVKCQGQTPPRLRDADNINEVSHD